MILHGRQSKTEKWRKWADEEPSMADELLLELYRLYHQMPAGGDQVATSRGFDRAKWYLRIKVCCRVS